MKTKRRLPHPIEQSLLHGVRSKSKLVEVLELGSLQTLKALVELGPNAYRAYTDDTTGRDIQYPLEEMAECHRRLARLLSRIETSDYVHSKKRRSYVTNAKAHANGNPVIKTDISKYFPNTNFGNIHRFYRHDLKCSPDVAWHLAKLSTFEGHIPTGSAISNPLAFFANRPLFEQINDYTQQRKCVMTLLQDDITVSGMSASKKMLNDIVMMIRKWGLYANLKHKKTKTYPAHAVKIITGVAVIGDGIALPYRRRKLLALAEAKVHDSESLLECEEALLKLRGRVNEADQVDPTAVHRRFRETAAS